MSGTELTIGLVGLDMSHAVEFTRRLNDPDNIEHVPGMARRRLAGRVEGFPAELVARSASSPRRFATASASRSSTRPRPSPSAPT